MVLLLMLLCGGAHALWPRVEAYTAGSRTLCLARELEWKSEQGFSSDILEAGFARWGCSWGVRRAGRSRGAACGCCVGSALPRSAQLVPPWLSPNRQAGTRRS